MIELPELLVPDAAAWRAWRAETRERRIREFVAMLARHETPYPQKARPT